MSRSNKHTLLNGKFLKDAKDLLGKQDYVQASEKLWGATAQIIKAVALKRGKHLRSVRQPDKVFLAGAGSTVRYYIISCGKGKHTPSPSEPPLFLEGNNQKQRLF